ncbi:hydroxymethylpyrimidine/phosphomethylpyrimidine kinase [Pseudoduganella ginsengisoli]|uniref:hydroxymethylpyrimidine kinase n=1 Tax=Pseudoduganella ginsengisoli TaxID=1462440 RepID=A0A6L6PYF3_9BURK|nr:hydroxymethylpyrimidine/phosphomethylpyrimidine kinase [Pseudoduganella ginsengisoli]MTW01988.1 hydroxymethylpyrimidine/phosphomethylpyrimidine kinase [Pseudoduganella ginsengisoli]
MTSEARQPCVLVFAGADPSGGAGIAADILAIHAQSAHALPVITALTVQDNNRVYAVQPVEPDMVLKQARALAAKVAIRAVKIGITGSAANALAIAQVISELRTTYPDLPVVLDPVLASGHGDLLSRDDAVEALAPLLPLATMITPNGVEAAALVGAAELAPDHAGAREHAQLLLDKGCKHVLITGGHGLGDTIINRWFNHVQGQSWSWQRLPGEFHGSGCTLASTIAGLLAYGYPVAQALVRAQGYTHRTLAAAYAIAPGQLIPQR